MMTKFNFKRIKNPISDTYVANPAGREPLEFTLRPFTTDTAFDINHFRYAPDEATANERMFALGAKRIESWKNVHDEEGTEIPFTTDNLAQLLQVPEFIPYVMSIGHYTLKQENELYPPQKVEEPKEEGKLQEDPDLSPPNLKTQ